MGWFDEQIKQRKLSDDKAFKDAFIEISDSVTGENISKTLEDNHARTLGAIAEIVTFYGRKMPDAEISLPSIEEELEYICHPMGIMFRKVELKDKWYRDAFGAYLATDTRTGTVAALIPDKRSGCFTFFDPEKLKKVRITKKNAGFFDTEAICFYKPLPEGKLSAMDIIKYAASTWTVRDIALPCVLTLFITLVGLITPWLSHYMFADVYESGKISLLIATVTFLVCVSVSRILMEMFHSSVNSRINAKTNVSVEAAIMMRVLSLPSDFFRRYSSGEIMQRIEYANSYCETVVDLIFDTGVTSLLSIVYISQIFVYAPSLVVPSLITIISTTLFSIIIALVQMRDTRKIMEAEAKESGLNYSLITGVQKIKLAGAEKRAFAKWGHSYAKTSKVTYNQPLIVKVKDVVTTAITLAGTIAIYFGAVKSGVQVADFYAFDTAYAMVLGAFTMLVTIADSVAVIKPTIDMIRPILEEIPENTEGKRIVTKLSGGIELNNVSFRYSEGMPFVLDNLSLKIRSGQYVAIVGKTGCGKSTLMRILLGFEKPQKGAVYFDGKDMQNIDLRSLRRNIGVVMQSGKLFQGDIYSNIAISAPTLTLDEAWEAAEMAGMADEIRRMPMGMNTLVSEGAGGISGGQRQRLMIARAIAAKPRILMFDEATSALDNITQKVVSDSLDTLKCTRIVIAHRLSTIMHCDRIIYLDGGKIIEDGTYDELIAKNGAFADLVKRQQLTN